MFAPTKVWRRWHVKVNQNQRRFAVVSALAASALPSLVLARGHRIEEIEEVPLVVSNAAESFKKTKEAVALLTALGAYADVQKVSSSRKLRAGKGKMRNRRHRQRRGPLIVYSEDNGIVRAFRNLAGVEVVNVSRLNLLQLAPGGHLGRFVIWTEGAFARLDEVFGTFDKVSVQKKDYLLPTAKISNPDVTRIINSTEIQSVVRQANAKTTRRPWTQHKNPLTNKLVLFRLNPYAKTLRRQELRMYYIVISFMYMLTMFVQSSRSVSRRQVSRKRRSLSLARSSSRLCLLLKLSCTLEFIAENTGQLYSGCVSMYALWYRMPCVVCQLTNQPWPFILLSMTVCLIKPS